MVLFSKGWNIEFGTLWATWDDKLTNLEGWSLEETIRRVLWEFGCWSLEVTMTRFLKGWDIIVVDEPRAWKFTNRS
jgi:hypothetical protein